LSHRALAFIQLCHQLIESIGERIQTIEERRVGQQLPGGSLAAVQALALIALVWTTVFSSNLIFRRALAVSSGAP